MDGNIMTFSKKIESINIFYIYLISISIYMYISPIYVMCISYH